MRRVLLLSVLAALVNVPWVDQLWVSYRLDRSGAPVRMRVVGRSTVEGRYFIRYRVPGSKAVYSARVSGSAYAMAKRSGQVGGEAVPTSPATNRLDGQVTGRGFTLLAVIADLFLLLAAAALWVRRRRSGHTVISVADQVAVIDVAGRRFTARVLPEVLTRLRPGRPTYARLTLLAGSDVVPGDGPEGLSRTGTGPTAHRLCGRVIDVGTGGLVIESAPGQPVRVRVGDFRARADLRELAEVSGELWLTR